MEAGPRVDDVRRSSARISDGPFAASRRVTAGVRRVLTAIVVTSQIALGAASAAAPAPQSHRTASAASHTFHAKVAGVIDGDTIHVVDDHSVPFTIRLDGIDCPESGQPFGGVARRFVRAAAFDRNVEIRVVDRDAHQRLVARVSVDGQDLSTQLLRAGLAWHYTEYSHDAALASAEQDARQAKRGLWSESNAVPPWVWRRDAGAKNASRGPDAESGPFFANTSSRVFHAASCRNAHCKNCSVTFATAQAAEAAGYRPAGDCLR